MCELFAISSSKRFYVNDYLKIFMSHSHIHPHGWGIAIFNGRDVNIEKEPKPAYQSDYISSRLESPIEVFDMIAHIRYASRGNLVHRNCHPFTAKDEAGRNWTLAHNGTIFQSELLDQYQETEQGSTDSERILCHVISKMNQAMGLPCAQSLENYPYGVSAQKSDLKELSQEERCELMDQLILETAEHNKTNLLVFDGEVLYVHTNMSETLFYKQEADYVMFATVPLDEGDGQKAWKPVPMMQLLAYRDGELIYKGSMHNFEYIKVDETATGASSKIDKA